MAVSSAILRILIVATIAVAAMVVVAVPPVHAQAPPGEALFIRASLDNDRPYLGQQITYSLRIYQSRDANLSSVRVRYNAPGFAGFWNSQQTRQDEYEETIGSGEYRVVDVQSVLFASIVGASSIEPAVLEVSNGASGTPGRLESEAVAVEVRPLPVPEPEGFTGAVGRFEISASADVGEGNLNEPVTLTVRVSGEGNIEALPDPEWPAFVGWRVIESPVSVESQVVAGQITGSRTYEIVLVAEQAGQLTIPEIRYPHFDPVMEGYVELATDSIAVNIGHAAGAPAIPSLPSVAEAEEDAPEVRPIKAVPPSLRQAGAELAESTAYWAAWAIPPLVVIGAVVWRRRRASQEAARAEGLRNNALPDARAALARAVNSGSDPRVAASEALLSYLSARLEMQGSGMTREALLRRLREVGASSDLGDRVGEVLTGGESARYTPPAGNPGGARNYSDQVSQLLDELEGALTA